jgi:hypothetical protein
MTGRTFSPSRNHVFRRRDNTPNWHEGQRMQSIKRLSYAPFPPFTLIFIAARGGRMHAGRLKSRQKRDCRGSLAAPDIFVQKSIGVVFLDVMVGLHRHMR